MAQQTLLSHIRQLIARDELPKALSQLHALLEHTPFNIKRNKIDAVVLWIDESLLKKSITSF